MQDACQEWWFEVKRTSTPCKLVAMWHEGDQGLTQLKPPTHTHKPSPTDARYCGQREPSSQEMNETLITTRVFSLLRLFRTDLSSIPSDQSTNLTSAAEACATRPLVVSRQLAATNHNDCNSAEFYRQLRRLPCYRQKMQKSCWLSGSLSVAATSAKCFTQYSLCSSKIKGIVVFVSAKT